MKAWEAFLDSLEESMGAAVVEKWLRPLKVVNFDACNLYLEAESSFQIVWFEEHLRPLSKTKFLNQNSHPIKIHFTTKGKGKGQNKEEASPPPLEIVADKIDPTMHFTNFIAEDEGEMVLKFFSSASPGAFNPIYLYGPSGVGKTHLLMAISHKLMKQGLNVFYVHAETFTEHVVKAIRNSQMQQFREIYRHQDVLIIDDIHCLSRKTATQEELFHTFNSLHTAGKQIILSSNLSPSRLEDIEMRLVSRFEWGIVLQLPHLSQDRMEKVLRNKAKLHHFILAKEVSDYLLDHFSSSSKAIIRALEALLIRHRSQDPISLEGCERLLQDLLQVEQAIQLSPEKILQATSAYFGIPPAEIVGKSQAKEYAFPRKIAMFLCRKWLNLPYLTIGRVFDRDHSTVMASIKQIEMKSGSEGIGAALDEIETKFRS